MKKVNWLLLLAIVLSVLLWTVRGHAQTGSVYPQFNGGYMTVQPGQLPTFANPTFNGGWMLNQPGSGNPPTFIYPQICGAYRYAQPQVPPQVAVPQYPPPPFGYR